MNDFTTDLSLHNIADEYEWTDFVPFMWMNDPDDEIEEDIPVWRTP